MNCDFWCSRGRIFAWVVSFRVYKNSLFLYPGKFVSGICKLNPQKVEKKLKTKKLFLVNKNL